MLFAKEFSPRISNNISKKKEKEVSQNIINKKANAKLDYVVNKYELAVGSYVSNTGSKFLARSIDFADLRFLEKMNLKYKVEHRLWAISYDLIYSTAFEDKLGAGPNVNCTFDVELKGKIRIKDAKFKTESTDERVLDILKHLNKPLIIERISSMDLTNFKISYRFDTRLWQVSFRSLIGSTTWTLIPPMTYLVKPKEEECIKIIELFELIGDALVRP